MRKCLCLFLSFVLTVACFFGCGTVQEVPTQPSATVPTQAQVQTVPETTEAEEDVLNIMILGSSRSVNAFHFLYQAFQDQQPEQALTLGIMYYSGCSMSMHTKFIKNNEKVYRYYYNTNGLWSYLSKVHMDRGLTDKDWDVVFLQGGSGDHANNMNQTCRTFLKMYVDSRVSHPHTLWWHTSWVNATDPSLFDPEKTKLIPEEVDQYAQLTRATEDTKKYVLNDPMFEGHVCTGTPMMYALKVLDVPETMIFRDHTHLTDFGCLLIAYSWYAQFTGNPVTHINLDQIDAECRQSYYQELGPLIITEEMKQIIIDTVNYTLKDPWAIPTKE